MGTEYFLVLVQQCSISTTREHPWDERRLVIIIITNGRLDNVKKIRTKRGRGPLCHYIGVCQFNDLFQ